MIYLLTDIDDTLLQTSSKMKENEQRQVGAVDANGNDLSFMTGPQKLLLDVFQSNAEVIPVTGRSSRALERVKIEFCSYKVVAHGALILDKDNKPLDAWMKTIKLDVENGEHFFSRCLAACEELIRINNFSVSLRALEDHGIPVYLSFKGKRGCPDNSDELDHLQAVLTSLCEGQEDSWRVHRNGRNMALLPPYTCKMRACQWLINHVGCDPASDLILTAGDSLSDLPFMQMGHMMVIPTNSQIAEKKLN